jgi:tetratricopeptide (TPR) repeat protein
VALLEQLVEEYPKVPEYRHLLACCYRDTPLNRFGRFVSVTQTNSDRAISLLRKLVADFPKAPDYRLDLCEALARPGRQPRPAERSGNAARRKRLEESVTLSNQLVLQYPNVPDYAAAHARHLDGLTIALFQESRFVEAEKVQRKAVLAQKKLVKQYPEVTGYSFWLGLMERTMGRVLGELGQLKEARDRLESATKRVEALWKKDARLGGARPFLGMAYRDLAYVLTKSGESTLAAAALQKADEFGKDRLRDPLGPRDPGKGRP